MANQMPVAYFWGDTLERLDDEEAWTFLPKRARLVEMVMGLEDLLHLRETFARDGDCSWKTGNRLALQWKAR
jgi:hypothetical protein